jgi:ABC-2 type transport system ATP-binding protein
MVESVVSVRDVWKSYDEVQAVRGLSFEVHRGEVFGLLGPNGSGKTTTIRMIVDILKPDAGTIAVLGGPVTPARSERLGYLPEERGLYQRLKVREVLMFLASLKGLERHVAARRTEKYLDRVELLGSMNRRMRELSRGMQQKVQIVATVLHEPDFLIMDEPFSGLDPVNRSIVIELFLELARAGSTVVLSTHQMDQVEALCSRVLLINRGQEALSGPVREIKLRFADDSLLVRADADWSAQEEVATVADEGDLKRVTLKPGISPEEFVRRLAGRGARIEHFQRRLPSLDEIYIKTVRGAP